MSKLGFFSSKFGRNDFIEGGPPTPPPSLLVVIYMYYLTIPRDGFIVRYVAILFTFLFINLFLFNFGC